jgi:Smg protein
MQKKEMMLLLQMIQEATEWLASLAEPTLIGLQTPEQQSLRIFTEEECEALSLPCRRFLLALEQQGIVDAALRERIIYHAMQLPARNMDERVVEGIVRVILSRQPEGAEALRRMELLVVQTDDLLVH